MPSASVVPRRRAAAAASVLALSFAGATTSAACGGRSDDSALFAMEDDAGTNAHPDATVSTGTGDDGANPASGDGDDGSTAVGTNDGSALTDATTLGNDGSPVSMPSDAGTDANPLSCAGKTYCDDFESYTAGVLANGAIVGFWKAAVSGVNDAGIALRMTIDAVHPHSGTKSLHIATPAGTQAQGVLHQAAAADAGLVAGNDMFGRAMVYYSDATGDGLPLGVHSWLFNSQGTETAGDGGAVAMNMGGSGGASGAQMQLNYHPPTPASEQSAVGGTMTTGVWHCVQWEYNGSGTPTADTARVWVDGVVAVDVPATKKWDFATPWNAFDFGFTHYQTMNNGVDIYLDDFALDSKMVPCP